MPVHFKGLTGLAREKALAEHKAITGEEINPDLGATSTINPNLGVEPPINPNLGVEPPVRADAGINYAPGGTTDAMGRSVTNYAGGGLTGYNEIGAERPMYKKGGNVPEDDKKDDDSEEKKPGLFKKFIKDWEAAGKEFTKNPREDLKKLGKFVGKKLKKLKLTKTQVGYDESGKRVERKVPVIKKKKDKVKVEVKKVTAPKIDVKKEAEKTKKIIDKKVTEIAKKDVEKAKAFVKLPPNVDIKKVKSTGKIRGEGEDVASVTLTGGGIYPTYKKKSEPAKNFKSAFAAARKAGKKTFTWDGRKYTTKVK
jgi:hypothetical protein